MDELELVLAPGAIEDIDKAIEYYNQLSEGLGFEFTNTIDRYLSKIKQLPSASAIRYDQVRVRPIDTFPFTIHYVVTDTKIIVLRIFNTYKRPI